MTTPQNPYHSCIVSAAAGAGKTWQLSRRFLFLVGAHAAPNEILTITFTRKAAAEMRARVIAYAAELAIDKAAQREFDTAINAYYKDFNSKAQQPVQPPLPAQQVGNSILSQSQKLNIATIDSICSEWLSSLAGQGFSDIPLPFKIVVDAEEAELQERSWQQLWQTLPAFAQPTVQEEGTATVQRNIKALHNCGRTRLQALNVPNAPTWTEIAQSLAALSPAFANCAAATTLAELQQRDVLRGKKIKRSLLTVAQKKQLQPQLQALDAQLHARQQADMVLHLNARGKIYFSLWQRWREIYQALKKKQRAFDFQDLTIVVQELLTRDEGLLFFLQQRIAHIMLDEFQDTSNAQWDVFYKLSCELLAGENCVAARQGLQATLFLVGDPKQSIYGFRGANAKIMHTAASDLAKFEPQHYPLAVNYRSAAHLLKFFNAIFPALALPDFYEHQPAQGEQQVADYGTVTLAPLAITEIEAEATYVAQHIDQALQDNKSHLKASDICILYRNSTHADVFRAALSQAGISSVRHEEQGFLKAQTSHDLLALCKWLALPQDQQALLTVLRSPLCAIPAQELLHIYAEEKAAGRVYHSTHILQVLAARYPQQIQVLQDIHKLRHQTTPCRLLLHALQRLGALHRYREHGGEFIGQQAQQNIVHFIDLIAAAEREDCPTLAALHVRLVAQAQHDSIGSAAARADAVTLMTIHKAKGLQFKYVVLVQAQDKWPKRDSYWLKTADSVVYSGKSNERPKDSELDSLYAPSDAENTAESLRLLYVALTRAEHYLLVCGSTPKRNKGHGFLERIVAAVKASDLSWQSTQVDDCEIITLPGTMSPPVMATTSDMPLSALPTARMHSDSLSQEVRILLPHQKRVASAEPRPEEHSLAARVYGIYLHRALEQHVKQATPPDRSYWDELAVGLGDDSERMWHKAERTLQTLFSSPVWQNLWHDAQWSKAEMPIVCLDNGLLINGVIDLLICYPQQRIKLIDYKTGAQPDDLSTYQQQLTTYCTAVSKLYPDHTITTALLFTSDCKLVPVA